MPQLFKTLKFQLSAAVTGLALLFALASVNTMQILSVQREDEALLRLGAKLQLSTNQMIMRAEAYQANAPRDYGTYYRDLKLYYTDLMEQIKENDRLIRRLSPDRMPGGDTTRSSIQRDKDLRAAALAVQDSWAAFRRLLDERLGADEAEPRLEWAAEVIHTRSDDLIRTVDTLMNSLDQAIAERHIGADRFNRWMIVLTGLAAVAILAWFVFRVLRPLERTVQGFRYIAAGNFGHRLPVDADNEVGWLASSVNRLTARIDAVFRLLTRIETGSDLDETMRFIAQTMPELMPLDWVGVAFITQQGQAMLERAYCDGKTDERSLAGFPIDGTPLAACLEAASPQHIHDLQGLATHNRSFRLVRLLVERKMRDAIFLPVAGHGGVLPSVMIFATRRDHAYQREHVELLSNLALLITLSFSKTLKLTEQARLAAIGEFASGIVHELRSPLTTVGLAIDYFKSSDLPEAAQRRAKLASEETERMTQLLTEILLYAKPLGLQTRCTSLASLVREVVCSQEDLLRPKDLSVLWAVNADPGVAVDVDRFKQVVLNLLHNAIDAADNQSTITVGVDDEGVPRQAVFSISNNGEPIGTRDLARLFEPFFTTKPHGTGLGMGIVRRIVEAHGGSIKVASTACRETTVKVRLPLADD